MTADITKSSTVDVKNTTSLPISTMSHAISSLASTSTRHPITNTSFKSETATNATLMISSVSNLTTHITATQTSSNVSSLSGYHTHTTTTTEYSFNSTRKTSHTKAQTTAEYTSKMETITEFTSDTSHTDDNVYKWFINKKEYEYPTIEVIYTTL